MKDLKRHYEESVRKKLTEKFGYENVMEVPRISKVVINRGIGEAVTNSKSVELSFEQLYAIAGQKPMITTAKKSISNFKLREGQAIGCKVTLRSAKMYHFLNKLLNVSLPKIRDFRGVPVNSFDGRGNYTLGVKEDTIFPEISYEKIDRLRGFDVTIVTTAKTNEEAFELLAALGMPFRKR
ncbi:50S ribosomal protein L5 [bacterium]|nr:50S ribosomal protein L5 [bacterium]